MNLLQLAKRGLRPQRVADDTPARIRDVRIGLEMAVKSCQGAFKLSIGQERGGVKWCLQQLRAIPDTDIMKEISRE